MSHDNTKTLNISDLNKSVDTKQGNNEEEITFEINDGKCIIPEGVTSIKNRLYEGMLTLTSVKLPSSLEKIEEGAFYRTGITDVFVNDGIKKFECRVPLFIKKIL